MLENSHSGQLIARYGYLAVLVGTMLEGETVVLVAGFFAHQGYLSLPLIMACAIIGSSISDQGLFFLSRIKGNRFLARFPSLEKKVREMSERLRKKPLALGLFALLFRFLYGLRNIAPVFLGLSAIPTLHFVFLNAVGAVLWAVSFSLIGFTFAATLGAFMDSLAKVEMLVAGGLAAAGCAFAIFKHWQKARG